MTPKYSGGESVISRLVRWLLCAAAGLLLVLLATVSLGTAGQAVLGGGMLVAAWLMAKSSRSYLVTLMLVMLSLFATFRYGYWRLHSAWNFFRDPASRFDWLDVVCISLLLGAEAYAVVTLCLGYLQTAWPLRRQPVPLPDDPNLWPEVDLVIPTYNEPLSVVRSTALAAANIDWPADKLNVYILDDGKRPEFLRFAEQAGLGYITRPDNAGAKGGNINNALKYLGAPFVAVFDCDHVPTRSFLQVTLGWFVRDQNLAMLQTPHHLYSADPFERLFGKAGSGERGIPNEGDLFYGIVQDGNDFWNATMFCGSCAVLRRAALEEIGGIATETVTEDAHTSLRLQMNGWHTAYINIPQAAGLATAGLADHVKQRVRWARGMIATLRLSNPLFARGLSLGQRLCYFNAMLHFACALPRLIFLLAPLVYLVLGHRVIPARWDVVLAFAVPHLLMFTGTNSRIEGRHRHSFWNEIYETVLAPFLLLPTLAALFAPRAGKFEVTAKGETVDEAFFDGHTARPYTLLLLLNLAGLAMAVAGVVLGPGAPAWLAHLAWTGDQRGTIAINAAWCLFNTLMLGVAVAVAWEPQQRRQHVRIPMQVPANVDGPSGERMSGETIDLSSGGAAVCLAEGFELEPGVPVRLLLPLPNDVADIPAVVARMDGRTLRLKFLPMSIQEEESLTMVLYSRADNWLEWGSMREPDRPLRSLARIFALAVRGLWQVARRPGGNPREREKRAVPVSALLVLCSVLGLVGAARGAATPSTGAIAQHGKGASPMEGVAFPGKPANAVTAAASAPTAQKAAPVAPPSSTFQNQFSLHAAGAPDSLELHGTDTYYSLGFSLPQNQVVSKASLHLRYGFSPALLAEVSQIKVMMNGTEVAALALPKGDRMPPRAVPLANLDANRVDALHASTQVAQESTVAIPPELLVHSNQITFEFLGHTTTRCEDPTNAALWARIDPGSTVEMSGVLLPLADDLKLLPAPFYDPALGQQVSLPVVFASQPDAHTLEAAGVVASYFGVAANEKPVRFPVVMGTIPLGDAIIVSSDARALPSSFQIAPGAGALVAVRTNPANPFSKLLVISGDDGEQALAAAQALAIDGANMQGATVQASTNLPAPRKADDAPRWLSTDAHTPLWDAVAGSDALQGNGTAPLKFPLRLPPDLYFAESGQNLALHLDYRYDGEALSARSSIGMLMNGESIDSFPIRTSGAQAASVIVPVPTERLAPFQNTLTANLAFVLRKSAACKDAARNTTASLLRSSYLDLDGASHWTALPNLNLFARAGFPFTRFADLSQTTIVLPDVPTLQEMELYLSLVAYFSGQTGYPALRINVANAGALDAKPDRDLLLLGAISDQPALTGLNDSLPVAFEEGEVRVRESNGIYDKVGRAFWNLAGRAGFQHEEAERLTLGEEPPDTIVEGIESPWARGRSIVVVAVKTQDQVAPFLQSFLLGGAGGMGQSVSVLRGTKFESYRPLDRQYFVGDLHYWARANLWFAQSPWLMVPVLLLLSLFLAMFARGRFRRRAQHRLQAGEATL